jgi:ElaB/YqjD/DUF883 family membrane-anchored ribosome-binding protein
MAKADLVEDANEQLQRDLAALREDLKALRNDVVAIGSAKAKAASASVEDQLHRASDKAKKFISAADEETKGAFEAVRSNVRENPIASLGAAVAFGMIVGRGMFRK